MDRISLILLGLGAMKRCFVIATRQNIKYKHSFIRINIIKRAMQDRNERHYWTLDNGSFTSALTFSVSFPSLRSVVSSLSLFHHHLWVARCDPLMELWWYSRKMSSPLWAIIKWDIYDRNRFREAGEAFGLCVSGFAHSFTAYAMLRWLSMASLLTHSFTHF